jgi:hypothetical protein
MTTPPDPRYALRAWADDGPPPAPVRRGRTTFGIWTPHGFWQLLLEEPFRYELPELTPDEQIEAARRYIQSKYNPWGIYDA